MASPGSRVVDFVVGHESRIRGPWRFRLARPTHPGGLVYGFLFRLVIALLAVIVTSVLVFIFGAFSDWKFESWMLRFIGAAIFILVFLGEHVRSRVYERISTRAGHHVELRVGSKVQLIDGLQRVALEPLYDKSDFSLDHPAKRVVDLLSAFSLLLLMAPILLVVAAAVRFESRGPIFFRQKRYGVSGRAVQVFKFRTMRTEGDGDVPRITGIGAFLRRTGLDELPQLVSVLRGEMSIVGPRPRFSPPPSKIADYFTLHKVKPGIVGLAQVSGYRDDSFEGLDYDQVYVERWSLWLDLKIIVRAIGIVLTSRPAY